MAKLWVVSTGQFDGSQHIVPIIAVSREQVGAHIKKNIEKFMPIFEALFYCKFSHGNIYRKLDKWYANEKFLDRVKFDKDYRANFMKDLESVLMSMTDEKVIEQLRGYNDESESIYVCINETSIENLVDLREN